MKKLRAEFTSKLFLCVNCTTDTYEQYCTDKIRIPQLTAMHVKDSHTGRKLRFTFSETLRKTSSFQRIFQISHESMEWSYLFAYRRIHHVKFLVFHGNQLEYNSSQSANGADSAGRIQRQGHEIYGKPVHNLSTTYVLIQSLIKQLILVVKQCLFQACNKSDHLQMRCVAAIILQFLSCLGNVTSWNTRHRKFVISCSDNNVSWSIYFKTLTFSRNCTANACNVNLLRNIFLI